MNAHMLWQTMKPVYVDTYDETFTAEELRPLVAFMKSLSGVGWRDITEPTSFPK